jgi:hypothetical protein
MLKHYGEALASDNPDPSSATVRMIEIATISRGASALILQAIRDRDPKAGTSELIALTGALGRLLGVERATLKDIGLDRKARKADDVMALLSAPVEDAQIASKT